mgnify:CR=1 FL=1
MSRQDSWERGRAGERVARQWLLQNGYIVIATSDIDSGGAPMLLAKLKQTILPDNVVFRAGQPAFVEVKTYQSAIWEQKRGRWQHGILKRHYLQYQAASAQCRIPCYLAIIEVGKWRLLLGELNHLAETMWEGLAPSRFGLEVYFDVNRFEWFPLEDLPGRPADVDPETHHPWDRPAPEARQGPLW